METATAAGALIERPKLGMAVAVFMGSKMNEVGERGKKGMAKRRVFAGGVTRKLQAI